MNSFRGMIKYTDCPLEAAAVLKLEKKDASTQYVVTTFPTEIFSGDRADKEGEWANKTNCLPIDYQPASQPEAPGGL